MVKEIEGKQSMSKFSEHRPVMHVLSGQITVYAI
jgi:hypothetical protein